MEIVWFGAEEHVYLNFARLILMERRQKLSLSAKFKLGLGLVDF